MEFTLEVGNRSRVWQMLDERLVDVAVTSMPPMAAAFDSLATRPNEFALVARPGLVHHGRVGEVTWLVREEGSSSRAATEEMIALLGISPHRLTIGSNAAIRSSAEAGLGVAVLPAETVADALRDRVLTTVHVKAAPLRRPWHLMVRSGEPLGPGLARFVEDLVGIGGEFELTATGRAVLAVAGS
jgi:DNA-binding transcriptional LysR family regulator